MGEYIITLPDGSQYKGEANSAEEAHAAVQDQIKQDRIAASKKEYEDAPVTSKARMIIGDPLRNIEHGLTAGIMDKIMGTSPVTQAAADRIGPTATTAARLGGAVMLPSGVPAAVGAIGGGPLVRGLVGAGTAAGEGGIYGGINAATGGENIPTGVLGGAVGGAIGQPIGQAVGSSANRFTKWVKGIDDAAPARNITTLPSGRTPSAKDLIDVAAAKAASTGAKKGSAEATQQAQRNAYEKLLTGKTKSVFTPTQRERMGDIVYGDPGTKAAETMGDFLKNKLVAGALGGGAGFASGGIIPGMLASGASVVGGKAMTLDSAKATQEAVDALRALMYKKRPFMGPMTPTRTRTIGQGAGYLGMTGLEDYLE